MASDELPPAIPGGPEPEEPAVDEYTAGFFDGMRAHRIDLVNHVRPLVAPNGIRVDPDLTVRQVGRVRNLYKLEIFQPDNPSDDPRYAEGFEAGYDAGGETNVLVLRKALLDVRIYLTGDGLVATTAAVDAMVKTIQERMAEEAERREHGFEMPRAYEAEDEATDGFEDEVEAEEETEADAEAALGPGAEGPSAPAAPGTEAEFPPAEGMVPAAAPSGVESEVPEPMRVEEATAPGEVRPVASAAVSESAPRRRGGRWSVITGVIHRRKALVCFLGGSLSTLLAFLPWMSQGSATPPEIPEKIQPGEWTPPTHWDLDPPESKARFLAIDHWVFDEEKVNGTPAPNVAFVVNLVMGFNGANDAKSIVAQYVLDTRNPHYLINLTTGIEPSRTNARVRATLLGAIRTIWHAAGSQLPTGPLLAFLQNYKLSEQETDPRALAILARLVSDIEHN